MEVWGCCIVMIVAPLYHVGIRYNKHITMHFADAERRIFHCMIRITQDDSIQRGQWPMFSQFAKKPASKQKETDDPSTLWFKSYEQNKRMHISARLQTKFKSIETILWFIQNPETFNNQIIHTPRTQIVHSNNPKNWKKIYYYW